MVLALGLAGAAPSVNLLDRLETQAICQRSPGEIRSGEDCFRRDLLHSC